LNGYIGSFSASETPQIIEIDLENEYIIIDILNVTDEKLHISSIVFSLLPFGQECNETRYVSIGSYHSFSVASSSASYYPIRNVTYYDNQKFCIWFASPIASTHILNYNTESTSDFLYITNNSANYSDFHQKEYTGNGSDLFLSNNSILMLWKTDNSGNYDGFHIITTPYEPYTSWFSNYWGSGQSYY